MCVHHRQLQRCQHYGQLLHLSIGERHVLATATTPEFTRLSKSARNSRLVEGEQFHETMSSITRVPAHARTQAQIQATLGWTFHFGNQGFEFPGTWCLDLTDTIHFI